jgi:hypothetical protein
LQKNPAVQKKQLYLSYYKFILLLTQILFFTF